MPGVKRETAAKFRQNISTSKSNPGQPPEELLPECSPKNSHAWILKFYRDYCQLLKTSNALDFDDLLIKGLEVVRTVPWAQGIARLQHLLVDEL